MEMRLAPILILFYYFPAEFSRYLYDNAGPRNFSILRPSRTTLRFPVVVVAVLSRHRCIILSPRRSITLFLRPSSRGCPPRDLPTRAESHCLRSIYRIASNPAVVLVSRFPMKFLRRATNHRNRWHGRAALAAAPSIFDSPFGYPGIFIDAAPARPCTPVLHICAFIFRPVVSTPDLWRSQISLVYAKVADKLRISLLRSNSPRAKRAGVYYRSSRRKTGICLPWSTPIRRNLINRDSKPMFLRFAFYVVS